MIGRSFSINKIRIFNSHVKIIKCKMYVTLLVYSKISFFFFSFLFFFFFWASPVAYESFQARRQIGAATASLRHSHGKAGFEPHL